MRRLGKLLIGIILVFGAPSCNILPGGLNSSGSCKKADGTTVNTYSIYGTWKKIYGYETPKTDAELELDYEILAVLRNGDSCVFTVTNGADTGTLPVSNERQFTNDVVNKTITFTDSSEVTSTVTYSYKDSCSDTKMTLTAEDGSYSVYQYRSKSTEGVSCVADP